MNPVRFMIDLETTGTDSKVDSILQVAAVPVRDEIEDGQRTGFIEMVWPLSHASEFNYCLHYPDHPANKFAKENLATLYKRCNALPKKFNTLDLARELRNYLLAKSNRGGPWEFIGWNARGLDLEFLIAKHILRPSFYTSNNELAGDIHYKIDEITGMISLACRTMNLPWSVVKPLALEMVPEHLKIANANLSHDALDDCYYQINLYNGLIALMRKGWTR